MIEQGEDRTDGRKHPLTILFGLTSLFADFSYEMAHVILPLWLMTLGGSAMTLSLLEIVSEFCRIGGSLVARRPSPAPPVGRIRLGYTLSMIASPLMALAGAPWHLVLLKGMSWFGKGIRGPSRDALLSLALPAASLPASFATIRALDQTGGILGPLFAVLFLGKVSSPTLLEWTVFPGIACVWFAFRATGKALESPPVSTSASPTGGNFPPLHRTFLLFLSAHFLIRMGLFPATLLMFEYGKNTGQERLMGGGFVLASVAHVLAAILLSGARKKSPWTLVFSGSVLLILALSCLGGGDNRAGFYLGGMILWGIADVLISVGSKSLTGVLSDASGRLNAYAWLEISGALGMLVLQPAVSGLWDAGKLSEGFWSGAAATAGGIVLLAGARTSRRKDLETAGGDQRVE
ncbi:MFS transporter [Leptospirillum ferriphilum]|uniref:MFS transporter n=1 Tax=Leptospirillum ferriphilum TaxID=178606 RepID=A0A1V3SV43_9BACT|nr:MFS transporter [Leptospirillum ferriphilum]OOH72733.1 hypothetical protein BOX24_04905 [Leptospirillum ferriphilum]